MQIKQIRNVKILSLITVVLVLIMGILSILNVKGLKKSVGDSFHTMDVLQISSDLYSALLTTESNIRGFMITKNKTYEAAYLEGKKNVYQKLDSLKMLTRDNPEQVRNIDSLSLFLAERIDILNSTYEAFLSVDTTGSITSQKIQSSLSVSQKIRLMIGKINHLENELLQERTAGLYRGIRTLPGFLLFIALISFGTAGLAFYSIRQYSMSQKLSQQKILQYQEQLQEQIQRLNLSNQELVQFAYVASHDLQEPLRKISAFSELLTTQFKGKLDSEGELYLERINSSANRMRNLIADLLNYSRVSRDTTDELVDLNLIVQAVKDDLEIQVKEKKAVIEVGNLPLVRGSNSEYSQLFQNLISNGLKFSKQGTAPLIRITSRESTQEELQKLNSKDPGQKYLSIIVSDNGIGFEEEYADKIFIIFQRLHGRDQYQGTGIGLAICKKIVEKNGGTIYATSTLNEGSSFVVIIPVQNN